MFFNRLGRDTEAVRNLLVGTFVKYPQRKCRTALRRQPIDRLLHKLIAFIPEQLVLQRLTLSFDPRITEIPHCVSLHGPAMTVFVRSKIARRRKQKSSERRHGLALPIGTEKRFLDDFFRGFTRPDEAQNVSVQRLAALSEELRENLGAGVRRRRHSRVIRFDLRYAHQGLHGNSRNSTGGFCPLKCRTLGCPPNTRLAPVNGPGSAGGLA